MSYVDGFVAPVAKDKLEEYRKFAQLASKVWREYGALDYREFVGDDVPNGEVTSFPRSVQLKDDEVVIFSYITYESREQRDAVMKKVMADPRMKMDASSMPFDGKRMIFGGFKSFVEN